MKIIRKNNQPYTVLHNGIEMPLLGLGVYNMYGAEAEEAISTALRVGYRLIDTAAMYRNEVQVGNAVRNSGIPRSEIFITTKVNNTDHGYDNTLRAFEESSRKLNVDHIDLYLVHWPVRGRRKETWKALEHLYQSGQVRAIGVANYLLPFLQELETFATEVPVLNQVEFSPYLYLKDLHQYCRQSNIQLQAYSPIAKGAKFRDPKLLQIARKYGKTPSQIMLRWDIELGVSPIPKSSNEQRLRENFSALDFSLEPEDVQTLCSFHENFRVVNDPMDMW